MKREKTDSVPQQETEGKSTLQITRIIVAAVLVLALIGGGILLWTMQGDSAKDPTEGTTEEPTTEETEPPKVWHSGYLATLELTAAYYDEAGTQLGTVARGTQVQYGEIVDGKLEILVDDKIAYLQEGASAVADVANVIPVHTLYIRTTVNLRDKDGKLLATLAQKGSAVTVTGYDYFLEDGTPRMYRVTLNDKEGYVMPWYVVSDEAEANSNYDGNGMYATHAARPNRYRGGDAGSLDYFPREKGPIAGNVMPEECRTMYIATWRVDEIDNYLKVAKNSGINAFVVDIMDGTSIGYVGDVMRQYSPSATKHGQNTVAAYKAAIQKIKDAGYYVIGRITTFNDSFFVKDHPETAITDNKGNALKLSGSYWPTAYNRLIWQYKVDLAVEAVELMGFNEIQFDYVRFPDLTGSYEKAGTIDFRNTYGETKAQAIQRFLMYATDRLHEKNAYVSADVFGESANAYVTAYGQYWPAISNVVDAISGMPYPDHYPKEGDWVPWLHPYETIYRFGKSAMTRQKETATPAAVRTWIQGHDTNWKKPYATYGVNEVAAQIKGLRDSGCTGGYMIWGASLTKYKAIASAFAPPKN